jgi:hypothetical protein
MKKILFIAIQYRNGERVYPVIPYLSKDYKLDLLKLYEMKPDHKWEGNVDLRNIFNSKYLKYFSNIVPSINDIDYSKYDLILCDDDRARNGVEKIYKNKQCLMVGCSHGNRDLNPNSWHAVKHHKVAFDKCFVFGKKETLPYALLGGIPSNDNLKSYLNEDKKHILVICNILGNHPARNEFKLCFDKHLFNNLGLLKLQQKYNKKIIIKLKSRSNESYKRNITYLKEILPKNLNYEILIDIEDDNKLISQSFIVISSPSTLAFKPIQLQIPTAIIKDSGANGLFYDFKGFVELGEKNILNTLKDQLKNPDKMFIKNTIEGGSDFTSKKVFLKNLKTVM